MTPEDKRTYDALVQSLGQAPGGLFDPRYFAAHELRFGQGAVARLFAYTAATAVALAAALVAFM